MRHIKLTHADQKALAEHGIDPAESATKKPKKRSRGKGGGENGVVKACLDLLRLAKIPAWRINNVGIFDQAKKIYRFNGARGIPDIIGVLPKDGRFLGVECKFGSGRVSEDQEAIHAAIDAAKGCLVVAWSVEDLAVILRDMEYLE